MAATLTPPTRRMDSEGERLRRRRDRHARLATDRALAEVAFGQRPRHRQERGPDLGAGRRIDGRARLRSS